VDFDRFLFVALFFSLLAPSCLLAQGEESRPDDALISFQGEPQRNYSEQTDAELFAAERDLKSHIAKEPNNAFYYFELSEIYTVLFDRTRTKKGKQSDEWIWRSGDVLEKVVMIEPSNKVAHFNLGVVYKRQGKMEKAREELKKAIRLCHVQQDVSIIFAAWMEIGFIYEEQGFWDEAQASFLKAREYDYGNQDVAEALREVQSRKQHETGSSTPFMMPSMGSLVGNSSGPVVAPDPHRDSGTQYPGMQALPYLGSMLAQKFTGGQQDGANDEKY